MDSWLFNSNEETTPIVAAGSDASIKQGCGLSQKTVGKAPPHWVSRKSTLILGCSADGEEEQEIHTSTAEWVLPIARSLASKAHGAVLVVCADRRQAGLHTLQIGACARVYMNDQSVDIIGLREKPQGHDDYFHRVTHQEIPSIPLIRNCGTVYSFNVPLEFLSKDETEKVGISVDPKVRWDIDHVVLVVKHTEKKFRPWVVAVVFTVLGAIGGVAATEVWKYLAGSP